MPLIFRAVLTALALAAAGTAHADPYDQDKVRQAVASGEIRPLAEIFDRVHGKLPGDIVGVEIDRKDGRWFYEFRVFDRMGRLFEVYVDGQTGQIARVKEK
jgi:uncharacterized membrane protein YkoI